MFKSIITTGKVIFAYRYFYPSYSAFKTIKKAFKITGYFLLALILLLVGFALLLKLPSVQTFTVNRITSYLSSELNARVEIEGVNIEFLKKVVLKGIYIEDQKSDTLLYAQTIKADIGLWSLFKKDKLLSIKNIELDNGNIELKRYKDVKGLNFKFIADYFSSGNKSTDSAKFDFNIDAIVINNTRFSYTDLRWSDYTRSIDWEDLRIVNLNAQLSDLKFDADTVLFTADNLSFKEYKGFVVNEMKSSAVKIGPGLWDFRDLKITTPYSDVDGKLTFNFDSIEQFDDFEHQVRMKSEFKPSKLSSNDLQYFAEELFGLDQKIELAGKIRGTVASLKGKEISLKFGTVSEFKGDIGLTGLPNVEETFMNLKIDKLITSKSDIETIKNFPFDSSGFIQLPENLSRLGKISFNGMFTGFYNDFVAYGNINTAIGYLSTDVNLKFNPDLQKSSYSGKLVANNFDFGKFWNNNIIGLATFDAKISGTGFQSSKVAATLDGNISSIVLNNYVYHNIKLDGDVARKLFNGNVSIDEPNLKLDFDGSVDFRNKLPIFDFTADIKRAYLTRLNVFKRDSSALLSTKVMLNMQGLKFDELDGTIELEDLKYTESGTGFDIYRIAYSSSKIGTQRLIKLNSEIVDADLRGDFRLVNMESMISSLISRYLPEIVFNKKNIVNDRQQLVFRVNIKKANDVLNVFIPKLRIAEQTKISGELSAASGLVNLNAACENVIYDKYHFNNIVFTTRNEEASLNSTLNIEMIKAGDSLTLFYNSIIAKTQRDKATVDLKILNTDSSSSRLEIYTQEDFLTDKSIVLRILPSTIKIENQNWNIDEGNSIRFDSTGTIIKQLALSSGNQLLHINGKVSKNPDDVLNLDVGQFNIAVFNQLLSIYDVSAGGITNGTVKLSSLLAKPIAETDLKIKNLCYFGDTLGDATVLIKYVDNDSKINFDCYVENRGKKEVVFDGYYLMKTVNDEMDFTIKVTRINASILTRYLTSFTSDFRGIASADLRLQGLAKQPILTGKAKIQKGSMVIDYLNTKYFFATENITLGENYIDIPELEINDRFNNKGMVNARVYHHSFSDFVFDVNVTTNKLHCLNTNAKQNELFYGTAFASGICDIAGSENLVNFDITLRSLEGTVINIPLTDAENVEEKDFITFINDDSLNKSIAIKKNIDLSGIDLDLKLEATPDAQIKLIFDEKIGDEMTGNGAGTLRMKITPAGEFNMYGGYTIEKGDYLFTMQNVINKRFNIDNGGSIRWSGDPYDAEIDIAARYKNLRASTYDLLQDTSNRKRIPVELSLQLTGNLFNPNVKFKIDVPGLDASLQNQLSSRLSTEEELNRQVFSLLVLNRFSPPEEGRNTASESGSSNSVGANAGELLSNQVTNWLSKLSKDVNIGVNYRPGDELNRKDEFEVSLSTDIFNDRVSIDGSFGVNNNTSSSASNVVGDFNVEFKASKDGRLRLRAFNKTNNNSYLNYLNSQYTQGIGIFYREEFNTRKELFATFKERRAKKEKQNSNSSMR